MSSPSILLQPAPPALGTLVVVSSLPAPLPGIGPFERAFADRLGAGDGWDADRGLRVWRDLHSPGRSVLASWWADKTSFARYMRSNDHQASHRRIPQGDQAPVLESLHRYEVLCT